MRSYISKPSLSLSVMVVVSKQKAMTNGKSCIFCYFWNEMTLRRMWSFFHLLSPHDPFLPEREQGGAAAPVPSPRPRLRLWWLSLLWSPVPPHRPRRELPPGAAVKAGQTQCLGTARSPWRCQPDPAPASAAAKIDLLRGRGRLRGGEAGPPCPPYRDPTNPAPASLSSGSPRKFPHPQETCDTFPKDTLVVQCQCQHIS